MMKGFLCCSLKTGSLILAVFDFSSGLGGIIYWSYKLQISTNPDDNLYHALALCHAIVNVLLGVTLMVAIVKGNHNLVIIWLFVAFCDLTVMMVFTGVHMFEHKIYIPGFLLSIFLWYFWVCVLNFFQELRIYNLGQKAVYGDPRMIAVPSSTEYTEQQVLC